MSLAERMLEEARQRAQAGAGAPQTPKPSLADVLGRKIAPEPTQEARPAAPEHPVVTLSQRMGLSAVAIDPSLKIEGLSNLLRAPGRGQRPGVGPSADLNRICALPRRQLVIDDQGAVERMNRRLRRPGSAESLRPVQAVSLEEMTRVVNRYSDEVVRVGGLVGFIGVGHGKTLISLLAPTVLDSKCAAILVPPNLRDKLVRLDIPRWSPHFDVRLDVIHVVAYSTLSVAKTAAILDELNPDLIIGDEIQALRNGSAARTKRFKRFMRTHPLTRLVALSGSLTTKSIRDYNHLMEMALGSENAPVPTYHPTVLEWSGALDSQKDESQMIPIGELERLCKPGETAREGFRRRLVETTGVVATNENEVGVSLNISRKAFTPSPAILLALSQLRNTWALPEGEELEDALAFARAARQLACGFYYVWDWPDGEVDTEWVMARRDWHREVRTYLTHRSAPGMDSPLLLANAAASGRWKSTFWSAWAGVKGRYHPTPPTKAVWVCDSLVKDAVAWGQENTGIIWYESVELGERIAREGGFPLFGPGEEAAAAITREKGDRSIVASVRGHGEGRDLQMFSKNLILQPSTNGKVWEQLLGRTHRPGQEADEVEAQVYLHTKETQGAVADAVRDAQYALQTTGVHQKLLKATLIDVL